jgi:threonine/homoserine/homoserine lactone efflux protein
MNPLNLAVTVIVLSSSGALAPGPLFFVTISHGIKSGTKSGILFSIAHSLIEFAIVMLLALGLLNVANVPEVRLAVGVVGGVALIVFGGMQIRSSLQYKPEERKNRQRATRNLLLIGFALTGLNPYFIVWWLTVGANLIFISLAFGGLAGVVFMYICHVWVDYVWLTLVSGFAKKSSKIIKSRWYRILMAVFGGILIYYGFSFFIDSLRV